MSEWISVKERLPEVGVAVMAFVYGSNVPVICSRERVELFVTKTVDVQFELIVEHYETSGYDFIVRDINQNLITHWMPLPEAPK